MLCFCIFAGPWQFWWQLCGEHLKSVQHKPKPAICPKIQINLRWTQAQIPQKFIRIIIQLQHIWLHHQYKVWRPGQVLRLRIKRNNIYISNVTPVFFHSSSAITFLLLLFFPTRPVFLILKNTLCTSTVMSLFILCCVSSKFFACSVCVLMWVSLLVGGWFESVSQREIVCSLGLLSMASMKIADAKHLAVS